MIPSIRKIFLAPLVLAAAVSLFHCSGNPSDLSGGTDEKGLHRLGAVPDNPVLLEKKLITKSALYSRIFPQTRAALPGSVDQTGSMPPAGNQGIQNSCTAWAAAYYAKSFQERVEENWDVTLPAHQFSPSWVYNQLDGGGDNGISVAAAFDLMIEKGCDTLDHFPYSANDFSTQPESASLQRASHFRADSWFTLPEDINMIKQYLAQNKVIIAVIAVKPDFDALSPSNQIYDDFTGNTRGHHTVCVIGYDDSKRALKLVNSWGTDWGTWMYESDPSKGKGYGWISYDMIDPLHPELFSSYILIDTNNTIVKNPRFSPAGGIYSSPQTVSIACGTLGASIRYTTNGENPSPSTGNIYTGPFIVRTSAVIKAIAYKTDYLNSEISSAVYNINSGRIKVLFHNEETSPKMNCIYLDIVLSNSSGSALDLSKLKLRYYYTKDFEAGQSFYCDYAGGWNTRQKIFNRLTTNIAARCLPMPVPYPGADSYAEIGFDNQSGSLFENDILEIKGRILNSLWGFYTQTNDYSFNPAVTNMEWNKVTGYFDNELIWGIEP